MTDEEREAARDELLAKIATLMAKRALEAAKKQLENIIEQQPDSEAAQTAKRMLMAMEPPQQLQHLDEQAVELAPTIGDPGEADAGEADATAIPQAE